MLDCLTGRAIITSESAYMPIQLEVPVSSLPIPEFHSIHEKPVIEFDSNGDQKTLGFISLDPMSGRKHRYSVLRVYCKDGKIRCIGRELDLETSRRIVKRPSYLDGKPLKGY